jgi:serine/threonine protein kinase
VDEYGIPKFDELQTCAINGNCRNRKVLDKPLEYSLTNVTETDEGWYSCKAENHFGAELTSGYITVVTEMPINSSKISKAQFPQTYAIIVGFSLVILMCFAACVYYIYRSQEKRRHRKEDIKIAQNINPVTKWVTIEQPRPTHAISDEPHPIQWPQVRIDKVNAQAVIHSHKHSHDSCKGSNGLCSFGEYAFDTDKEWELDRSKLIIGEILGEGEFGRVAGAILDNKTKVAVKMLKEGHTDSDVIDLVKEMSAMKQMVHDRHPHNHPNVIKMIGACTQPVGFPLLVVVEFAEFGNLKEYLLSKKPLPRPPRGILQQDIANTSTKGFYEIPVSANALSFPCSGRENYTSLDIKELLNMAWQVSKGMTYLSQRKFVHRDLAARNILVCSQNVYKIADFGMARPVEQKEYYRRTSNGKVPLKWMAPESMFEGVHTTQSDVWSYGILLWEIFSYGDSPYKGLGVDVLLEFLKQCISLTKNAKDYMMEQPPRMDNGIYHLMGECWNFDDALRPNWPKIEERTRKFYEDAQPRIYLEMDGAGTPSLKKGSSLSRRDRVGSTSSRITASSISTNATMLNPTMEETAPLIRSSSGYCINYNHINCVQQGFIKFHSHPTPIKLIVFIVYMIIKHNHYS